MAEQYRNSLLQVLKNPATRAAYNQQLALEAAQQQVFVSQTITLADMELATDEASDQSQAVELEYSCRCGGAYCLDSASMNATEDRVLVQCDTCSLHIEVCRTLV